MPTKAELQKALDDRCGAVARLTKKNFELTQQVEELQGKYEASLDLYSETVDANQELQKKLDEMTAIKDRQISTFYAVKDAMVEAVEAVSRGANRVK